MKQRRRLLQPPRLLLGFAALAAALACAPRAVRAGDLPAPPATPAETVPPRSTTAWLPERLLLGFQGTTVGQWKPSLRSPYQAANSLRPEEEGGYTISGTLYLGARPWRYTEIFVNPEAIHVDNLSGLHGLGGPSNGEAQKSGGGTATLYLARAFVRQTIPLGGEALTLETAANQFALATRRRRLVITAGNLSILDVFDGNSVTHDPRTQFLNWALLTHGAFDFAADARGYTWGLAVECYLDAWAIRAGRFLGPKNSNGLALDFHVFTHYGDNLEIEHAHSIHGWPGRVRLLGFRNHERMGAFADAVSAALASGGTPALDGVRRDQSKLGFGVAVDQSLGLDATAFLRGSWNDGRTETYSFTEIDHSLAAGASLRGPLWRRPDDTVGAAWVMDGLSGSHRDYLAKGGLGFFIGDGQLDYRPEQIVEVYYSALTFRGLWLTADYQHVTNPAYNADRGPANFLGARLHVEL